MSLIFDGKVKDYVWLLAERAPDESPIFPVSRAFLESNLDEIQSLNPVSFLYYNFELVNDLYTNQLFVCLPEVWKDINLDDLILLCKNFTYEYSYYVLIKFTYKYLGIDIIAIILSILAETKFEYLGGVIQYLQRQWNVLIKTEEDLLDFEDNFIAINPQIWQDITQNFLTDKRVKPALLAQSEMKGYIDALVGAIPTGYKI